jgi:hypothetical protein
LPPSVSTPAAVALVTLAAAALAAGSAAAQETAPLQLELQASLRHAAMTEYAADGVRLVRESGWLPGAGAMLAWRAGLLDVYGKLQLHGAALDYDGRLQNGAPHTTSTDTVLSQAQLGLGYRMLAGTRIYAALEHDGWRRDIRGRDGVTGLRERSTSVRLLLGIEQSWPALGGAWTVGAALLRSRPERLRLDTHGIYDTATMQTRSATGYVVTLGCRPSGWQRWSLQGQWDYIKVPRSAAQAATRAGIQAGAFTQPEHVRKGAALSVRYAF